MKSDDVVIMLFVFFWGGLIFNGLRTLWLNMQSWIESRSRMGSLEDNLKLWSKEDRPW